MGRRLLAVILGLGLPLPAMSAGWFDGLWTGEIISTLDSRQACGFSENPVRARVDNGRFTGTIKDARSARTFEGAIDDDHRVSIWPPARGRWRRIRSGQA